MRFAFFVGVAGLLALLTPLDAFAQDKASLADELRKLDAKVLSAEQGKQASQALFDSLRARRDVIHENDRRAWNTIETVAAWTRFRDQRVEALRRSLGQFPPAPTSMAVHVTRTIQGEGFFIDNLLFESRPGLWVTANLYRPASARPKMPGLVIIPSHHNPKTQGELQDMGMTWARLGSYVLVADVLGHGERRQHPFVDAKSYPEPFKAGRQDYYFRYNTAIQLDLVGESLTGWIVWDTMRGIDVLLRQPGIDPDKIILLGSVAGGGDPAAVTAALDPRIKAAVPFNFGGPQPETKHPLPKDADTWFNYMGGGSWESTRGLRFSGRDGFLPWVIVTSLAPRGLIYAHEFAWDKDRDPVWKRLETIYGLYEARDRLSSTHGEGSVRGSGPGNTHCNNIGPEHRAGMYPALKKWFDMPIPEKEYRKRLSADELRCWTPVWEKKLQPKPLHEMAARIGHERALSHRRKLETLPPREAIGWLHEQWSDLLGMPSPWEFAKEEVPAPKIQGAETKAVVYTMSGLVPVRVPVLYLMPAGKKLGEAPLVVGIAQEGKAGFLKHRSQTIAALVKSGIIVCLPDLRGCGETKFPGDSRGRTSTSTSVSSTEWMLGSSLLGQRLLDLLAILPKQGPIALWGDSFAQVNPPERRIEVPWDADNLPNQSEPLGGILAMLGGLYHPNVKVVYVRGGLVSYQSILDSQFLYVPHDVIVPGLLTAGDLCDVAAALAPRPVRLEALVDGRNRAVALKQMQDDYAPTTAAYKKAGQEQNLNLREAPTEPEGLAQWFIQQFKRQPQ